MKLDDGRKLVAELRLATGSMNLHFPELELYPDGTVAWGCTDLETAHRFLDLLALLDAAREAKVALLAHILRSHPRLGKGLTARSGLRFAVRSLAVLARRAPDLAEELLAEELPWLHRLPESDRRGCLRELLAELVTGVDTGLLWPFARSLASWRATAGVWSDLQLAHEPQGPFPGDGPELDRPASGGQA